jgi:hypothetical protein
VLNIDKMEGMINSYKKAFETNKEIGRAYMHEDIDAMLRVLGGLTRMAKEEMYEYRNELVDINRTKAKEAIANGA